VAREIKSGDMDILGICNVKRVQKVGSGYAVILPVEWLRFTCGMIDSNYWVQLAFDGDRLEIKPVSQTRAEELLADFKEKA